MKTLTSLLLLLLLTANAQSQDDRFTNVFIDRAEVARQMIPFNLRKIDQAVALTATQKAGVQRILEQEVATVAKMQQEFFKHRDIARILRDAVDLNLATMAALRDLLGPEHLSQLRPFFVERRDRMVNDVEVLVNTYWVESAQKAGFAVEF